MPYDTVRATGRAEGFPGHFVYRSLTACRIDFAVHTCRGRSVVPVLLRGDYQQAYLTFLQNFPPKPVDPQQGWNTVAVRARAATRIF